MVVVEVQLGVYAGGRRNVIVDIGRAGVALRRTLEVVQRSEVVNVFGGAPCANATTAVGHGVALAIDKGQETTREAGARATAAPAAVSLWSAQPATALQHTARDPPSAGQAIHPIPGPSWQTQRHPASPPRPSDSPELLSIRPVPRSVPDHTRHAVCLASAVPCSPASERLPIALATPAAERFSDRQ